MRDEIKRGRIKRCRICERVVRHHNKSNLCNKCIHKVWEVNAHMGYTKRCKKCKQGKMQIMPNRRFVVCNYCGNSEKYTEPEIDEKFIEVVA